MIVIDVKWARPRMKILRLVIEAKSTIPVLDCVMVRHDGQQTSVAGTNLDEYLRFTTPKDTTSQAQKFLIPFRLLDRIVHNTEAATIQIESKDGVTITAGDSTWNFAAMELDRWPNEPRAADQIGLASDLISIPAARLKQAILMTGFCRTKERSRFSLHMTKTIFDKSMTAIATDGHRMMVYNVPALEGKADFQLSETATAIFGKLKFKMAEMQKRGNFIFCETDDMRLTTRNVDGNFPNYQMVLPPDTQERHSVIFHGAKMKLALREAIDSSDRRDLKLEMRIGKDRIELENIGSETLFKTSVPGRQSTTGVHKIWINPKLLLDYLKVVGPGDAEMRFIDSNNTLEFNTVEKLDYTARFICMPLRQGR